MRIVIVGDGKVGVTLTEQLSKEGHDIVIVDSNEQVLQESSNRYDIMTICGNGASLTVQKEAGVSNSDLLIAVTSKDEVNLLTCILGRKLGVKHTIARVRNPEYAQQLAFLKEELGLSLSINPERAAAIEILNLLRFPAALKRDTFAKGRVEIIELKVSADSPLNGCRLSDLPKISKSAPILICAVTRGDDVHIPSGDFCLQAGDKINVTGTLQNLTAFVRQLKIIERRIRYVMLIGGSRVAFYLSAALSADGTEVKIIERDPQRCEQLAALLPRTTIICADGSRPSVLASEGFEHCDALVTLTDIDEENIVVSMYASQMGVPKVITKINGTEYNAVCRNVGVECAVSPKSLVCSDIVRYVRAMENTSEDAVLTLHRIVDNRVDALEFLVTNDTLHQNEKLRDIKLKSNLLLASINRNGQILIPGGNDCLQKGDSVVIVTTSDHIYHNINAIFA